MKTLNSIIHKATLVVLILWSRTALPQLHIYSHGGGKFLIVSRPLVAWGDTNGVTQLPVIRFQNMDSGETEVRYLEPHLRAIARFHYSDSHATLIGPQRHDGSEDARILPTVSDKDYDFLSEALRTSKIPVHSFELANIRTVFKSVGDVDRTIYLDMAKTKWSKHATIYTSVGKEPLHRTTYFGPFESGPLTLFRIPDPDYGFVTLEVQDFAFDPEKGHNGSVTAKLVVEGAQHKVVNTLTVPHLYDEALASKGVPTEGTPLDSPYDLFSPQNCERTLSPPIPEGSIH